ncbi:glycosyltransferase [Brachyspira intermedia]|uniref:glycosyltransferase n=1 Tax=Brachyspira intermedia TaxID=84377 RepID=UPI00262A3595|nr:glycosyltransferase [uncultured Brachyspira sp.]
MKKLAILLCSTTNQIFAVGNVLIGLKKHFSLPEEEYDIILYVDKDMNIKDENALKKIYKNFIINKYDKIFGHEYNESNAIKYFTNMAHARYEVFDLLNEYEKILYLDTDVLIQKDIAEILDMNEYDMYAAFEKTPIKSNLENQNFNTISNEQLKYDIDRRVFNSGVLLFNKKMIKDKSSIKEWCYNKAEEWKSADQVILNLMVQEFNINIGDFTNKYNRYVFDDLDDAIIVHSCAWNLKFWDGIHNKEWEENNKKWLSLGGSKYKNIKKQIINAIAWWIPNRKLRDKFRSYFYQKHYIR